MAGPAGRVLLANDGKAARERPFGVGAYYPKSNVHITGENRQYTRTTAAGRPFDQHFCPNCGSTVYFWGPNKPDAIGIAVGAFADLHFPAPTRSVWEQSRHDWLELPEGLQHFMRGRDFDAKYQ